MNYQPIREPGVSLHGPLPSSSQRRCQSSSQAAGVQRRYQLEQDSVSLPGQLNVDNATSGDVNSQQPSTVESVVTNALSMNENSGGCGSVSLDDREGDPDDLGMAEEDLSELQDLERSGATDSDHDNREMLQVDSRSSISVSPLSLDHSIEIHDGSSLDETLSRSSTSNYPKLDSIINYGQRHRSTPGTRKNVLTYFLYALCAVVVYPILLVVVPFSLMFKLISQLCCCLPCRRRKRNFHSTHKQEFPLFFASRPGGYHTIGIELSEHMSGESFVEYAISKLSSSDDHGDSITSKENVIFRLVSTVQRLACFSWWEMRENVDLEEHIEIVSKRITTATNFTDFVEQLYKKEVTLRRNLLWRLYFFPFFKTHGSAILLLVHHSILSGVKLKELLVQIFSDGYRNETMFALNLELPLSRPSFLEAAITGPGILLRYLLRPSLSLIRASNKYRYVYSSPMYLHEACHIANLCNVSLHSLFMASLSQSLRNLYSQKYPFGRVNVAIPVVSPSGQNSVFFVNLPLTKSTVTWDTVRLQQLDKEIYSGSKDSYILLSAAKLASLAFSPCTVDFIASSILRGADVLFHVVYCPSGCLYLDHDHALSSILYWPPLFNHVNVGVCVVVYEQSFRVCIATDYSVTDWSDILLKQFIANYSELYQTLIT